jgi:DeoR family fructose operon transcriptional repressor
MNSSRRTIIKELLSEKPFISLKELEESFPDVSSMTLRRDIEYFEKQGEAIKVRGGARSMKFITTSMEDSFHQRMNENMNAKERIAKRAIELIETGRSLFLDSGTTVLKLASLLPDERHAITTTGPNIALELIKKNQPIVNLVGGMINRENVSISGNQALKFLADINIDIAFLVPSGLSLKDGFTSGNYSECELKRMVVEKARRVVILMDKSKINRCLPFTFSQLENIHTIVTDDDLPEDITNAAKAAGVEIIVTK